jgi:uncharacterized alkaline shock family protein YloU
MEAPSTGATAAIEVAEAAARAACDTEGVVEVTAGPGTYRATYGPGRRVNGVTVRRAGAAVEVEVSISVSYGYQVVEVGEAVRRNVEEALRAGPVPSAPLEVSARVADLAF